MTCSVFFHTHFHNREGRIRLRLNSYSSKLPKIPEYMGAFLSRFDKINSQEQMCACVSIQSLQVVILFRGEYLKHRFHPWAACPKTLVSENSCCSPCLGENMILNGLQGVVLHVVVVALHLFQYLVLNSIRDERRVLLQGEGVCFW